MRNAPVGFLDHEVAGTPDGEYASAYGAATESCYFLRREIEALFQWRSVEDVSGRGADDCDGNRARKVDEGTGILADTRDRTAEDSGDLHL